MTTCQDLNTWTINNRIEKCSGDGYTAVTKRPLRQFGSISSKHPAIGSWKVFILTNAFNQLGLQQRFHFATCALEWIRQYIKWGNFNLAFIGQSMKLVTVFQLVGLRYVNPSNVSGLLGKWNKRFGHKSLASLRQALPLFKVYTNRLETKYEIGNEMNNIGNSGTLSCRKLINAKG